jgi:hypothetical protein
MPLHIYLRMVLLRSRPLGSLSTAIYAYVGASEKNGSGVVSGCVHWPPLRARNLGGRCRCRPAGARHGASRSLSVCWCCADGSSRSQLLVRTKTPLFSDFSCIHDSSFYRFIFISHSSLARRPGRARAAPTIHPYSFTMHHRTRRALKTGLIINDVQLHKWCQSVE